MCLPIFSKVCKIYSVATTSLIINVNMIWWGRQGETEETERYKGRLGETEGDRGDRGIQRETEGYRGDRGIQGETEGGRWIQRENRGR